MKINEINKDTVEHYLLVPIGFLNKGCLFWTQLA
jgi:hypothetical protein